MSDAYGILGYNYVVWFVFVLINCAVLCCFWVYFFRFLHIAFKPFFFMCAVVYSLF